MIGKHGSWSRNKLKKQLERVTLSPVHRSKLSMPRVVAPKIKMNKINIVKTIEKHDLKMPQIKDKSDNYFNVAEPRIPNMKAPTVNLSIPTKMDFKRKRLLSNNITSFNIGGASLENIQENTPGGRSFMNQRSPSFINSRYLPIKPKALKPTESELKTMRSKLTHLPHLSHSPNLHHFTHLNLPFLLLPSKP